MGIAGRPSGQRGRSKALEFLHTNKIIIAFFHHFFVDLSRLSSEFIIIVIAAFWDGWLWEISNYVRIRARRWRVINLFIYSRRSFFFRRARYVAIDLLRCMHPREICTFQDISPAPTSILPQTLREIFHLAFRIYLPGVYKNSKMICYYFTWGNKQDYGSLLHSLIILLGLRGSFPGKCEIFVVFTTSSWVFTTSRQLQPFLNPLKTFLAFLGAGCQLEGSVLSTSCFFLEKNGFIWKRMNKERRSLT